MLEFAAIPTTLAGFHAYAIVLFLVWFSFEQWKVKDEKSWNAFQSNHLEPTIRFFRSLTDKLRDYRDLFMKYSEDVFSSIQRILSSLHRRADTISSAEEGMIQAH